jgi:hypothetical protein
MVTARALRAAGLLAGHCQRCLRPWARCLAASRYITPDGRPAMLCLECWEKERPIATAMAKAVMAQKKCLETLKQVKGGEKNDRSKQLGFRF